MNRADQLNVDVQPMRAEVISTMVSMQIVPVPAPEISTGPMRAPVAVVVCPPGAIDPSEQVRTAGESFDVVLVVPDARTAADVVNELTSRPPPSAPDLIAGPDLTVVGSAQPVTWAGRPLPLSRHEREIVHCLLAHPGRVWTYQQLHERVWGGNYLGDPAPVHSAIKRLRRKLHAADVPYTVDAVRGCGFRLVADG